MSKKKEFIRSRAPLRISFGGGGTDVPPYSEERGGAVLNTTINKYAYCTIFPRSDKNIRVRSLDFGSTEKWKVKDTLRYNGNLDLVKAVLNHFDIDEGFDMFLQCDAPPGSGLGSSSTVIVAIIGAVSEWLHIPMTQYEIADLAYVLEREDLKLIGGKQDQYAATFGGFNYMEFSSGDVVVTPLRIRNDILNELHYCLLLCHTGKTRSSGNIIKEQKNKYQRGEEEVKTALDTIKKLAGEMKNTLVKGNIRHLGWLLDKSWESKKKFTDSITNPYIDNLYETAIENGAIGGKISGAGGGGFMFFICEFDKKHIVADKLEKIGAEVIDFTFDKYGLQTWRYYE
jgi:D-glycero-alpha-D-manno-heptose-7-phosphate kinase